MINYLLFFMIILSFFQNVISLNYTFYTLSVQKWCTLDYQIHGLWPTVYYRLLIQVIV
jgi:hypothetical protein